MVKEFDEQLNEMLELLQDLLAEVHANGWNAAELIKRAESLLRLARGAILCWRFTQEVVGSLDQISLGSGSWGHGQPYHLPVDFCFREALKAELARRRAERKSKCKGVSK